MFKSFPFDSYTLLVVVLIRAFKQLPMRGGSFIVYLLLFFQSVSNAGYAQNEPDSWILKEILKDSTFTGEIVSQSFVDQGPFFLPADLNFPFSYSGYDNLVKNKNGLFINIDGTGRIYQVSEDGDELIFTRIDSTIYTGYNNGAFVFSFNDTIYSLGGYGFWDVNGQLRYYRQSSFGWEIKPVNRKIPMLYHNRGIYLDHDNASIHYMTISAQLNESLKKKSDYEFIKSPIFVLDLKTKDWKEAGTPTTEFMDLRGLRIATLPWGELFLQGPGAQPKFDLTLMDYRNNKIYALKNAAISNTLYALRYGEKALTYRTVSYYHDSVLTILTSKIERHDIPLKKSDFIDTGMSIYVPSQESSIWNTRNITWLGIIAAVTLSTLGFVFWTRRKQIPIRNSFESSNTIVFDQMEQELIRRFLTHTEPSLSVDEVDQILETSKKSKDVQNQKRSSVTRSINNKFVIITGDQSNLISTSRLEFDRRMIQYKLDIERYRKFEHLFK